MSTYADLEISLRRRDETSYEVELRFSQPDSQVGIKLTPENLAKPEKPRLKLDVKRLRQYHLNDQDYGQALTAQLFGSNELQESFRTARRITQSLAANLRVRLWLDPGAPELHSLRWETLRDPDDPAGRLLTNQQVLFSRFLDSSDFRPVYPQAKADLKAVVAIANPTDLDPKQLSPVDVDGELKRAMVGLGQIPFTALARPQNPAAFSMVSLVGPVTLDQIQASLSQGCDILYLVCHGGVDEVEHEARLWLEDATGHAAIISGQELITRLGELEQLPRLVVLASCQSAGTGDQPRSHDQGALAALGPRLTEAGVPAVLAMQGNITMSTIEQFMPRLFTALQEEGQIDKAVALARGAVRERPDWWMPVLFMRLKDGQLWDASPLNPLTLPVIERLWFEPETVYIPAGEFLMGSDPGESVSEWETPRHLVNLPAYRIGKYPVTNEQYAEFIRQTGRPIAPEAKWEGNLPPADKLCHPVMGVTWYDALAYCQWLSEQTQRSYTLPSEEQWEKAARGNDGRVYPWGNEWNAGACNNGVNETTPVDAFPQGASPYGCYDMIGNVREWTCTIWGPDRFEPDPQFHYPRRQDSRRDDLNAPSHLFRVHRGGAASDSPNDLRCSARYGFDPNSPGPRYKRHGFRVILKIGGA